MKIKYPEIERCMFMWCFSHSNHTSGVCIRLQVLLDAENTVVMKYRAHSALPPGGKTNVQKERVIIATERI